MSLDLIETMGIHDRRTGRAPPGSSRFYPLMTLLGISGWISKLTVMAPPFEPTIDNSRQSYWQTAT